MQAARSWLARGRAFTRSFLAGVRALPARLVFSIKLRMVLVFLVLAAALMVVFIGAMRQVVATRWQLAAQPLLVDYVDRLAEEITVDGHPSVERARALVQRLPVTVRIEGPVVRWVSHPQEPRHGWGHEGDGVREGGRRGMDPCPERTVMMSAGRDIMVLPLSGTGVGGPTSLPAGSRSGSSLSARHPMGIGSCSASTVMPCWHGMMARTRWLGDLPRCCC